MENTVIFIGLLAILSYLLTFLIKFFALKNKIIDIPNERSSHVIPTPRGGGLAIVLSWFIGISVLFYFEQIDDTLYYTLMSGILLAIIGLIDDIINLKPTIRLLTQFLVAFLASYFLFDTNPITIAGFEITYWFIYYPISIIGIIWFINLFNFLDGIDAYASIEAMSIAIVLFLFTGNIINLILFASILGFLIWNWPKAKIFMGDVGSTQLGFVIIVLGLHFNNTGEFLLIYWLIISSVFWFDASYTLFRRWRNKEHLTQAHKKHAYQRIVQAGFSHLKTGLFLIGINIILTIIIFISKEYTFIILPVLIFDIIFMFFLTKLVDERKPF